MRLISMLVALFVAVPAHAGWRHLDWWISVEDVLADEKLNARAASLQEAEDFSYAAHGDAKAVAHYATPDFATVAYLLFRENELSGVALDLGDRDTALVARARLRDQYGATSQQSSDFSRNTGCTTTTLQWRDEQRGNNVLFRSWDCQDEGYGSYVILYTPIVGPADTGL